MIEKTSIEAFHDLRREGALGAMQQEALRLIRRYPGRTARELAEIGRHPDPNVLRPRIVELARLGYIGAVGTKRCTVTGRRAIAWRIREAREQGELDL